MKPPPQYSRADPVAAAMCAKVGEARPGQSAGLRSVDNSAVPLYILKREEYFILTGESGLPEVTATDEMALRESPDNLILLVLAVAETRLTNRA
jgi:hypothetical protein